MSLELNNGLAGMAEEGVVEFYDTEEDLEDVCQHTAFDLNELTEAIKVASEGALITKTVTTYRKYNDPFPSNLVLHSVVLICLSSLWKSFERFLADFNNADIEVLRHTPDAACPRYIAGWIYQKCERPNPTDPLTSGCEGASFSHALKMRAAVSYHYAQQPGIGSEKWHQDGQRAWLGNPALSHMVSCYMISLQRRKVCTCSSSTSFLTQPKTLGLKAIDSNRRNFERTSDLLIMFMANTS
jgi:hypothetical protein